MRSTQDTWQRLEQMFDARLTAALSKLGVPSRKDIEELTKRLDDMSKDMRKHSIGLGVKTGFSNVMTTQVRRARDDLSDLARELEEAQLAAKQAGKKQEGKKNARASNRTVAFQIGSSRASRVDPLFWP